MYNRFTLRSNLSILSCVDSVGGNLFLLNTSLPPPITLVAQIYIDVVKWFISKTQINESRFTYYAGSPKHLSR